MAHEEGITKKVLENYIKALETKDSLKIQAAYDAIDAQNPFNNKEPIVNYVGHTEPIMVDVKVINKPEQISTNSNLYNIIQTSLDKSQELVSKYSISTLRKEGEHFYVGLSRQDIAKGIENILNRINSNNITSEERKELSTIFSDDHMDQEERINALEKYTPLSQVKKSYELFIKRTKNTKNVQKLIDEVFPTKAYRSAA